MARSAPLLLAVLFLVSTCATSPSNRARKIQEVEYAIVKNCRFLGDVYGSAGRVNVDASISSQDAKNKALDRAASLGATHVVWTNIVGGPNPYVLGYAYRCR